jgi:putative glycosyltransferase
MKLSIVTTLFYSSEYINEFYERITNECQKITDDYEIIFVDDGSPDDSLQNVIKLYKKDSKVKIIELSKNFGHHKAMMTGLIHAKGDFIFLIDVDLEEEPELLGKFWKKLQSLDNIDVIYSVQKERKGGWFERWSGTCFWQIINLLSSTEIPKNMSTARLMTSQYNQELIKYQERELFIGGVWADVGFRQQEYPIKKKSHSKSTYNLKKKISLFINSITSFSSKPLVYIFNMGLIITLISFIFILKLVFNKLFYDIDFEGWTSLIVSIWFFGGVIILLIGIIGIYLSKIFIETKNRPYTIIRKLYTNE